MLKNLLVFGVMGAVALVGYFANLDFWKFYAATAFLLALDMHATLIINQMRYEKMYNEYLKTMNGEPKPNLIVIKDDDPTAH